MKATDLLKEQHQEIDELFDRISVAESGDMSALRDELAANLVGHSAIEREIFYPASREALGASFQLQTAFEEHALVEYALQKLLMTEPSDESFHARVSVLKELVQHHVEEEERELLKQAEGTLSEQQNEELGARMEGRFEEVRESDVEALLASSVAQSMPTSGRRAPAQKSPRKAAAKRAPMKRAPTKRAPAKRAPTPRAEPARATAKGGRRGAATGRKKPSTPAPAKGGRAAPSTKQTRATKTSRTGRKGGRSTGASPR
jgi:hypothetical protein